MRGSFLLFALFAALLSAAERTNAPIKTLPDGKPLWDAIEPSLEEKRVGLIKDLPNVREAWEAPL